MHAIWKEEKESKTLIRVRQRIFTRVQSRQSLLHFYMKNYNITVYMLNLKDNMMPADGGTISKECTRKTVLFLQKKNIFFMEIVSIGRTKRHFAF